MTDGGNPIALDMRTRYVIKGIGKEQTINSKIVIFYDQGTGKITKVEDKWDGQLPDSSFKNVSLTQLFRPSWWLHYTQGWAWYLWSFTWDTWWWQVCVVSARAPVCIVVSSLPSPWDPFRFVSIVSLQGKMLYTDA